MTNNRKHYSHEIKLQEDMPPISIVQNHLKEMAAHDDYEVDYFFTRELPDRNVVIAVCKK